MRSYGSKESSRSAFLYTYLCLCICVAICDFSAHIHCFFSAACTDTMSALSPTFSQANELGREFFLRVLVTGTATNHKQKIPSPPYIALSKCRSHQLH